MKFELLLKIFCEVGLGWYFKVRFSPINMTTSFSFLKTLPLELHFPIYLVTWTCDLKLHAGIPIDEFIKNECF